MKNAPRKDGVLDASRFIRFGGSYHDSPGPTRILAGLFNVDNVVGQVILDTTTENTMPVIMKIAIVARTMFLVATMSTMYARKRDKPMPEKHSLIMVSCKLGWWRPLGTKTTTSGRHYKERETSW